MSTLLKWFLKFPASRLSRRIGLWVFFSVIVIETIILIPSYNNRKKELLDQIKDVSSTEVSLIMEISPSDVSEKTLLQQLKNLTHHHTIVGGTLYRPDGGMVGFFGEKPELTLAEVRQKGLSSRLNPAGSRLDVVCTAKRSRIDYFLVVRNDSSFVKKDLFRFVLRITGLVVIISLFVTAGAWLTLGTIVVTPILRLRKDLIEAGEAISKDQQHHEFLSSSFDRKDELGEVIVAFKQMYRRITDAISQRKRAEEALQRSFRQVEAYSKVLDNELKNGRRFQKNFLPIKLPYIPGWESAAYFKPARQVSGDFYDVFKLPGHGVGLVVADVCDKGVGAALFMALFRSLLRIFAEQGAQKAYLQRKDNTPTGTDSFTANPPEEHTPPTRALKAVSLTNNYIATHHDALAMFATLFFGVLDPDTGVLNYISGGHGPLFIIGPKGEIKKTLTATGPAVGVINETKFNIEQATIMPGDVLLGFTDGVTDAKGSGGEFFGINRLLGLLGEPAVSAEELINKIAAGVSTHTGDADQHDDITLLAMKRRT